MDQNIKSIVKALANTDIRLIVSAMLLVLIAKMEKKAPSSWYNGAPGGWPTSRLEAVVIYSPASQKLAVGSTVSQYVSREMKNTDHPKILFHLLKLKSDIENCMGLVVAKLLIKWLKGVIKKC
jgi:hypothetical protein